MTNWKERESRTGKRKRLRKELGGGVDRKGLQVRREYPAGATGSHRPKGNHQRSMGGVEKRNLCGANLKTIDKTSGCIEAEK